MRKFIFLLFSIMTLQIAFAEDVIYLTNGDEIKSLVSEVTSTTVKYKKFSEKNSEISKDKKKGNKKKTAYKDRREE